MAIVKGSANVIFGGPKGAGVKIEMGDVIILPAGVGHKCVRHSDDFLCVGAYPQSRDYDMNYGRSTELEEAIKKLRTVPKPSQDPVFGKEGFVRSYWK
jgi:uncharacterized protein YjlB